MGYHFIPEAGFLRLHQIIGAPRRGIPPIIPVSKTTWYEGVKDGRFPRPVKFGRLTLWRVEDIRDLLTALSCAAPLLSR
ncbi:MAG: AlpA family phage regulatory protein [Acidobacteria bacterium]|nr:AlpA family phage regulatory protein [Acidobacteriota bacterium]